MEPNKEDNATRETGTKHTNEHRKEWIPDAYQANMYIGPGGRWSEAGQREGWNARPVWWNWRLRRVRKPGRSWQGRWPGLSRWS